RSARRGVDMTSQLPSPDLPADEVAGALADRLFTAGLGAFELVTIALGDRLGLYRALADVGPATIDDLAAAAGTEARYTRGWCEQQAAAGLLAVDDAAGSPEQRRFSLPPGSEAVLLDPRSPAYLVPVSGFLESVCGVLPALESAYRSGAGV